MFCTNCGKNIPEGSNVCPYCGKPQRGGAGSMGYQPRPKVNNIFSALVYEKTPGAIAEFVLWCTTCVVVLLSLIALITGEGNPTWIFLMIFSIGIAVIMAFRLKPIAMLYGAGTFSLITMLVHYISFVKPSDYWWSYESCSYSPLNITLFILGLLLAIAIVTCGFIHFFSKIDLGNVMTILVIVHSSLTILLQILMYVAGYLGSSHRDLNRALQYYQNERAYWLGTIAFWIMLVVLTLLYTFFFWGCIDNSKDKIIRTGGNAGGVQRSFDRTPGIRGISGSMAGRVFYIRNQVITIGSANDMMIVITDPYVSGKHCAIRYNQANGFYEIYDNSTNGVILGTGMRLQKGTYNSVKPGNVICIGSNAQQFQLL